MPLQRKLTLCAAALIAPVLVFALPIVLVLFIGPQRTEALARWLSVYRQAVEHSHPAEGQVPVFSLIDQEGRSVSDQTLRGNVWIASFFLSRCAGTCPMTSAKMARLHTAIADQRVKLISFSMDAEHDTPNVLREYAKRFHADSNRWHMLTGDPAQIAAVVQGLGVAEVQGQQAKDMIHSDHFLLINRDGQLRGHYNSTDPAAMQHVADDATTLAKTTTPRSAS
jgi:protein SCO1